MAGAGKSKHGFTLIELLVVIAVIAVLMSILMPSLRSAREQARRAVCLNHISSAGKLLLMYAQDNEERLPPDKNEQLLQGFDDSRNRANYYVYYHTGHPPDRQGFTGMGYLYKAKLLPVDSDLPFCPSQRNSTVFGTSSNQSDGLRNAKGNPDSDNYIGPGSRNGLQLRPKDEWIGWINHRWSWGWRNIGKELKVKKLSQAKSSYVYASDLWAAGGSSEGYWKTEFEDIPHKSGRTRFMNAWYLGGHGESHRWNADEYFDDVSGDKRYLNKRYTWRTLFEGQVISTGSNRTKR